MVNHRIFLAQVVLYDKINFTNSINPNERRTLFMVLDDTKLYDMV